MDSYESERHQEWVRRFLDGRFENSVFCILAPNGQTWLTRASRGPHQVLGSPSQSIARMKEFAGRYEVKGDPQAALVEDFHSVRQSLNVASADQRVLVHVTGAEEKLKVLRESLRPVANNPSVIGRYHFDFDDGYEWRSKVTGAQSGNGIFMIKPGEFGLDGKVLEKLSLDASSDEMLVGLEKARQTFAGSTAKKVYSQHVAKGRQLEIYFEGAVEYGEDRDGDGEIDRRGRGGRSSRSGRSKSGPRPESRPR